MITISKLTQLTSIAALCGLSTLPANGQSVESVQTPPPPAHRSPFDFPACHFATREECLGRSECWYSEVGKNCNVSVMGNFEKAFEHYMPGVHFHFFWSLNFLLATAYLLCAKIFAHPSMPDFLKSDPSLMSYTIVSGLVITFLAGIGCVGVWKQWGEDAWHTPYARLTQNTIYGDMVGQIHASYQVWNLAMAILRNDGAISVIHHGFCAYLGALNAQGFGCYHMIYMGGVAEISTIILTVMDIFKNNPYLVEKYPTANLTIRQLFCAVFLLLRVVVWWVVLYKFFADIWVYLSEGTGEKYTLHCYVNIVSMVLLTFIQLIWARLVMMGILKFLGFMKKNNTKGKRKSYVESRRSSASTECSTASIEGEHKKSQ